MASSQQHYSLCEYFDHKTKCIHVQIILQLRFPTCDLITRTALSKHLLQIGSDLIGYLPRREVAASLLLGFKYYWTQGPTPGERDNRELLRRITQTQLHFRYPLIRSVAMNTRCVRCFIVDPKVRSWASGREPVYAYPCQDFIVRPRILIRPIVQFLVYPGQQSDRAVL